MKDRRPIPIRKTILDVERNSLTSDLNSISTFETIDNDFIEREIILLRYPIRKPIKM